MTHDVLSWPFEPGKTVVDGKFLVKELVAVGGMGRIYEVEQTALERPCVLKLLDPKLHPLHTRGKIDGRALLEAEAKILSRLSNNSDSFVAVFDRGTAHVSHPTQQRADSDASHVELDLPYYAMELLRGSNFLQLIDAHRTSGAPMSWSVVIHLCTQAARALSIAHAMDIVHNDIKPNNIFLHKRIDRTAAVKFIDFGIATKHGAETKLGTGTRQYGAPELMDFKASRSRDNKQSDIYSLCLVFYEIATLRGPFDPARQELYAYCHMHETPPLLSEFRADAPRAFVELVDAGLAKRPEDRPTAEGLAAALEALGAAGGAATDAEITSILSAVPVRARARRARVGATGNAKTTAPGAEAAAQESDVFLTHPVGAASHEAAATSLARAVLSDRAAMSTSGAREPARPTETMPIGMMPVVILDSRPPETVTAPPALPLPARSEAAKAPAGLLALLNDTIQDGPPLVARKTSDAAPKIQESVVGADVAVDAVAFSADVARDEDAFDAGGDGALAIDRDDVPEYTSMAAVFAGWDDTSYQPSPFDAEEDKRRDVVRPRFDPIPVDDIDDIGEPVEPPPRVSERIPDSPRASAPRLSQRTPVVAPLPGRPSWLPETPRWTRIAIVAAFILGTTGAAILGSLSKANRAHEAAPAPVASPPARAEAAAAPASL